MSALSSIWLKRRTVRTESKTEPKAGSKDLKTKFGNAVNGMLQTMC